MCQVLGVSESGYYRFLKNLGKPDRDAVLSAAMDYAKENGDADMMALLQSS